MKQVVVINISNRDLRIPELRQILPAGTIDQTYVLPYDIAIKYKQYLYPVKIIDPNVKIMEDKPNEEEYSIATIDEPKNIIGINDDLSSLDNKVVKEKKVVEKKVMVEDNRPLAGKKIKVENRKKAKLRNAEKFNG